MSTGISYRLIVLYLVPIDRRPWYSGEGTSPLRVIELSWSDKLSAGISYRLIVLYLVPIDRRLWYSGEGTSPLRVIELSWSDGMSAGISYRLIVLYLVPIDRRPWYSGEGNLAPTENQMSLPYSSHIRLLFVRSSAILERLAGFMSVKRR